MTSAVSGRTNYLIYGHILEDGRETKESSKYKKAESLGTKRLNEEEFQEMIKDRKLNIIILILNSGYWLVYNWLIEFGRDFGVGFSLEELNVKQLEITYRNRIGCLRWWE